jgi:hypothetical protein
LGGTQALYALYFASAVTSPMTASSAARNSSIS